MSQFTTVTAQVLDPRGQYYANALYSVDFINQSTVLGAPPPNLGGSPFQTAVIGARCDSSARLSVVLADNNVVLPTPSQWRFSIQSVPYTDPSYAIYSFIWQGTITGVTQDISGQLQSVSALLPTEEGGGPGGVPNYADNIMVAGSGQNWSLPTIPVPPASLQLFQQLPGFGMILLTQGLDYILSGSVITTFNSLSPGVLWAWYRF